MNYGHKQWDKAISNLNIMVEDTYCVKNAFVPAGFTIDFLCEGRQDNYDQPYYDQPHRKMKKGSLTITSSSPWDTMALCQVEALVRSSNEDKSCYDGNKYPNMEACSKCIGPGPSQCTSCGSGNVLVALSTETKTTNGPPKKTETTMIGACRKNGAYVMDSGSPEKEPTLKNNVVSVVNSPGISSTLSAIGPSISTKWGTQKMTVEYPVEYELMKADNAVADIECGILKYVWCESRVSCIKVKNKIDCQPAFERDIKKPKKCQVQKKAWLRKAHSIAQLLNLTLMLTLTRNVLT